MNINAISESVKYGTLLGVVFLVSGFTSMFMTQKPIIGGFAFYEIGMFGGCFILIAIMLFLFFKTIIEP